MTVLRNICIVDTTYSLMLYLLNMDMSDIYLTLFFTGDTVGNEIREKLPFNIYLPTKERTWQFKIRLRLNRIFRWHCFLGKNIYAQDHIEHADLLIGEKKYTLLEDAPGCYKQNENHEFLKPFIPNRGKTIKSKLKYHFSHSSIYGKTFGTNRQCVNRWVTDKRDFDSKYINNLAFEYINVKTIWKNSSPKKKRFILSVFDIKEEDVRSYQKTDIVILTQPFMSDCNLSEKEMLDLYKPYIESYKHVVIKPHPRDKFEYQKYFPQAQIMKTTAPMQLFNLLGFSPLTAMTVSSTALSAMPETTHKIFLGTGISAKLNNILGDIKPYDNME